MDMCTENNRETALFFTFFNKILEKVSGKKGYKFNPIYFLCGEGGANFKAIKVVYGVDFYKKRVVGCLWHFLIDVKKKANLLPEDSKEHFTAISRKLCNSTTSVSQYNLLKGRLEEIAKKHDMIGRDSKET